MPVHCKDICIFSLYFFSKKKRPWGKMNIPVCNNFPPGSLRIHCRSWLHRWPPWNGKLRAWRGTEHATCTRVCYFELKAIKTQWTQEKPLSLKDKDCLKEFRGPGLAKELLAEITLIWKTYLQLRANICLSSSCLLGSCDLPSSPRRPQAPSRFWAQDGMWAPTVWPLGLLFSRPWTWMELKLFFSY